MPKITQLSEKAKRTAARVTSVYYMKRQGTNTQPALGYVLKKKPSMHGQAKTQSRWKQGFSERTLLHSFSSGTR